MLKIRLSNYNDGRHHLDYELSASEIVLSDKQFPHPIQVGIDFEKVHGNVIIKFNVKSLAVVECDRTLREFEKFVEGSYSLFYGPNVSEPLPGVIQSNGTGYDESRPLTKNDIEIDITEDVRETLLLAIPIRNVIEDSEEEMKAAFEYKLPEGLSEKESSIQIDPADKWLEALQKLRVQSKN